MLGSFRGISHDRRSTASVLLGSFFSAQQRDANAQKERSE
jgi:hypothetical protein